MFTLFVCGSASAFKLPDTGQATCYDQAGNVISCPAPGEPLAQDGSYNINPLSYTDNDNGTVTDNNTGLIWQQEDDGLTYNWFEASGTYDTTYNPTSQDVCGSLTLGGHSDWRLPSKKELMSIVNYMIPWPGPTIDSIFINTKSSDYWSSTTFAGYPNGAWGVNYGYGSFDDDPESNDFYVRCVRAGQLNFDNFTDDHDGTLTDNSTGLVWQQGEPGPMMWEVALSYCDGLSLGGHTDWRLPNIKELESITDSTRENPAIDTAYFPNAQSPYYWSSTTYAYYPHYAWGVLFLDGYVGFENKDDDFHVFYVRCVRGGQSEAFGNLTVDPTSYDFGSVTIGSSSAPQTFTISNTGTADLHISDIALSDTTNYSLDVNGGINPCGSTTPTITSDGSCTVTVTFSPFSKGIKDANLTINSDDPDTPTVNESLNGTGIPLVECNLVADWPVVVQGGTLGFQGIATNNTNEVQLFKYATRISLPNGNKYPYAAYLVGPVEVTLNPHQSKSKHLSQYIPHHAPLGTYTYHGYVGNYGVGIYDECTFTFTVNQQGQGCNLCHQ